MLQQTTDSSMHSIVHVQLILACTVCGSHIFHIVMQILLRFTNRTKKTGKRVTKLSTFQYVLAELVLKWSKLILTFQPQGDLITRYNILM